METESGCQCFCWIWWQRFIDQTLVVSIKYYWTISQVTCQLATNPCKTENQWLQVRVVELQCTNGLILLLPCIRITRVNEEGHSSNSNGPEMENGWLIQTKNAGEYFQLLLKLLLTMIWIICPYYYTLIRCAIANKALLRVQFLLSF